MKITKLKKLYPVRQELLYTTKKLEDINHRLYSLQGVVNKERFEATKELQDQQLIKLLYNKQTIEIKIKKLNKLIEDIITEFELEFNSIQNIKIKNILRYRYILCWTWEEISEHMGYSTTHIFRLHKNAIKNLLKK